MKQAKNDMIISMRDIFVEFDGEVILNHINLDIKDKEFVAEPGRGQYIKRANYNEALLKKEDAVSSK